MAHVYLSFKVSFETGSMVHAVKGNKRNRNLRYKQRKRLKLSKKKGHQNLFNYIYDLGKTIFKPKNFQGGTLAKMSDLANLAYILLKILYALGLG